MNRQHKMKAADGKLIRLKVNGVGIVYQPATGRTIYELPQGMTGEQLKDWIRFNCDWSM